MKSTSEFYDTVIEDCQDIFVKKMHDYGTAWRILRSTSLTDQIFIKAQRIRTIEELKSQKIEERVDNEYKGIINYCVMALIQLKLGASKEDLSSEEALKYYQEFTSSTKALLMNKNHDYGEAWRDMRVSSITDLILMKILRVKQIEDHQGKTLLSEGIDANYMDMINYCVFALYKITYPSI